MTLLTPEQQKAERLRSMARTFQRANTTLAGRPITVEVVEQAGIQAPGYSIGDAVFLNIPHIGSTDTTDDIVKITGLDFHELAHAEYTPRAADSAMVQSFRGTRRMQYFNILEDQRIETMLSAKYPSMRPYFVMTIMQYIVKGDLKEAHALTHGRKYLPEQVRSEVAARWGYPDIKAAMEAIIDQYRRLAFPRDTEVAWKLVIEFERLLSSTQVQQAGDPYGHGDDERKRSDCGGDRRGRSGESQSDQNAVQDDVEEDDANGSGSEDYAPSDEDGDDNQDGSGDTGDEEGDGDGEGDGDTGDGDAGDGDASSGSDAGGNGDGDADGEGDGTGDGPGSDDGESDDASDSKPGQDDGQGGGYSPGNGQAGAPGELTDDQLRDLANQVAQKAANDPQVKSDALTKRAAMERINGDIPDLETEQYALHDVAVDGLNASNRFKRVLMKLWSDADPGWHSHKASGRVNVQRAMRGGELDTLFDQWDEGKNDANSIELVLLVDYSTSMRGTMDTVSQSLWAIKRAVESIGGEVTVIGFSSTAMTFYSKKEKAHARRFRAFDVDGGTQPGRALDQARMIMHYSKATHKIVMFLTDGAWGGAYGWAGSGNMSYDEIVQQFHAHGVATALGFLPTGMMLFQKIQQEDRGLTWDLTDDQKKTLFHGCQSAQVINTPADLVPLAEKMVKQAMRS